MPKNITSLELPLAQKSPQVPLCDWIYAELRSAILDGRLKRGTRLPATRDFARQHGIARGTALLVFEQLRDEGYLKSRTGAGTWVNEDLPDDFVPSRRALQPSKDTPQREFIKPRPLRAFRVSEPAVDRFPIQIWSRIASRKWRRATRSALMSGEVAGYPPLRRAIAEYLGASRGVRCSPEQLIVVTGTQQALDFIARLFLRAGDPAWMEDPGYVGATAALRNAGARIVPVPVDTHGVDVEKGVQLAPKAKLAYVTPAHQFPLGMAMTLERRLALLRWAKSSGAMIVEDDYDSEYRFTGKPIPALQGLDTHGSVVFVGSFSKVLFPGLRLGYMVVPERIVDRALRLRFEADVWVTSMNQAILTEFITEGHLGRHIRRMRETYAIRLDTFREAATRYMNGILEVPTVAAGLATAVFYNLPISSLQVQAAAAAHGVDVTALEQFAVTRRKIRGLLLGFGAFEPREIRNGMQKLAAVLEQFDHMHG